MLVTNFFALSLVVTQLLFWLLELHASKFLPFLRKCNYILIFIMMGKKVLPLPRPIYTTETSVNFTFNFLPHLKISACFDFLKVLWKHIHLPYIFRDNIKWKPHLQWKLGNLSAGRWIQYVWTRSVQNCYVLFAIKRLLSALIFCT